MGDTDSQLASSSSSLSPHKYICDQCQRARRTCDKYLPCTRCTTKELHCTYSRSDDPTCGKPRKLKLTEDALITKPKAQKINRVPSSSTMTNACARMEEKLTSWLCTECINRNDTELTICSTEDAKAHLKARVGRAKVHAPDERILDSFAKAAAFHEIAHSTDKDPAFHLMDNEALLAFGKDRLNASPFLIRA